MKIEYSLWAVAAFIGLFAPVQPVFAQDWALTSAPSNYWSAVACSADGSKLVATANNYPGAIYLSADSGITWAPTTSSLTQSWVSVASSVDGTKLVAAANNYPGAIYTSADSGVTWVSNNVPSERWSAVASSEDGSKLVAADDYYGVIFTSTNSGATWRRTSAPSAEWLGLASSADGTKLVAVDDYYGAIYTSTDSGLTWRSNSTPTASWSAVASSADGTRLVAAAYSGVILASTNGGAAWTQTSAPSQNWFSVACSADGAVLLAIGGYSSAIYASADSGATWTLTGPPGPQWNAVVCSADGSKVVAACFANGGGPIYTWQPTIPVISQPVSQTVPGGIDVTLAVNVFSLVPFVSQWMDNGVVLPGATNATLVLTNVGLADSGAYSVLVSNIFGSVLSSNALLTIFPALVTTQPATGILDVSAVFNGLVTPGSNETLVWFEWGTDTNYGNTTTPADPGTGLASLGFSNSVFGLTGGWLYHYRAVASNILGVAVGADASFTTLPLRPAALAFSIDITSVPLTTYPAALCGVAVDSLGNIYATDTANCRVLKFSANGQFVTQWSAGSSSAYFALGLAVDNANNIFVANTGDPSIRRYNSVGGYVTRWGTSGTGIGQFQNPNYLAAATQVYVCDSGNFRIQRFSTFGAYNSQWGSQGTNNGQFNYGAAGVAVDGSNNVYVVDPGNERIQKFTSTGAYLAQWGAYGAGVGQFNYPSAVAADGSNNVYVVDQGNFRIERFAGDGTFLSQWSIPNGYSAYGFPPSIAVSRSGNLICLGDTGNNRIVVYVNDVSLVAPLIVGQPLGQIVPLGANPTFSVRTLGATPLGYQWEFQGTPLADATNSTLTLTNVGFASAGNYTVTVSNSLGTASSINALLTVVAAFATTQPANGISTTGAILNGMGTAATDGAVAWFEWGTNTTYGNTVGLTNLPATGSVVAVAAPLVGLVGDYIYHFRLGVSAQSHVVYGADQQFALGRKVFVSDPSGSGMGAGAVGLTGVVAVAAGYYHNLALKNNGTVAAWGNNGYGQLNVPAGLSNVIAITAGDFRSSALKSDGTVVSWGGYTNVPGTLSNVVAIASFNQYDLALRSDGSVVSFGQTDVPPGLTNIVAIAAGETHGLALKNDGTVVAWGYGYYGQTNVPAGLNNVIGISAGLYQSMALKGDGTVVAWGNGQGVPPGLNSVAAISCNINNAALKRNGAVVSWSGTAPFADVPAALGNIVAMAEGSGWTLVLAPQTFPDPITLAASGVTTNAANLNSSVNPNGANTTAWFRWGTNISYGQLTAATLLGNGSDPVSLSSSLLGLTPNTTYHCQVVASNFLGLVAGADVAFTTPGPPFVTTMPATMVSAGDAVLNGLVTPNQLSTLAWFQWGPDASYGNLTSTLDVGSGSVALSLSNLLSGLNASAAYHFRLVASNYAGITFGADQAFGGPLDTYAAAVIVDQPLIYYRFEEAAGPAVLNYGVLGAAGNGTYAPTVSLGNPSLEPSFGSAAGFNGLDSSVAIPRAAAQNQFTIEAWMRPGAFQNYSEVYAQNLAVHGGWALQFNSGPASLQLDLIIIDDSPRDATFGDLTVFLTNQWVHIAATYDSAAQTMIGYVNGQPNATTQYGLAIPVLMDAAHLGAWNSAYVFNGLLDEFALYDRALGPDRILAHYQAAIGAPVLALTAAWPLLTLSWIGPGYVLQQNTDLSDPTGWRYVTGGSNSPVSLPLSNAGNQFFRLRKP